MSNLEMKFEDLRNYRVTNQKILDTGWKPCYNIEKGIRQVSELILDNRIKDVSDLVYSNAAYMRKLYEF